MAEIARNYHLYEDTGLRMGYEDGGAMLLDSSYFWAQEPTPEGAWTEQEKPAGTWVEQ